MKTSLFFPALVLAVGMTAGVSASASDVVKPSPAPVVADSSEHDAVDEPAVIDHVVYLAKLPSPDELMKGAESKGTPIVRMDQTADKIVVVYQYAGGRTVTFAYTLLSTAASSRMQPQPQAGTAPVTSSSNYQEVSPTYVSPPPTVVYTDPDVYYAPSVRYYDPAWDFWTPLAVGVGLGWGFGGHSYYHGGWHGGGWHGGGGFHGGGGWHGGHR